jgi:HPt (histidine-containing phosphotransfer) domain-containing protein
LTDDREPSIIGRRVLRSSRSTRERKKRAKMDESKDYDPKWMLELCRGEPKMIAEVRSAFRVDASKRIAEILEAIDRADIALLVRSAHTLRGICLTIGAEPLASTALAIEQAALAGDVEKAHDFIDPLIERSVRLFEALDRPEGKS